MGKTNGQTNRGGGGGGGGGGSARADNRMLFLKWFPKHGMLDSQVVFNSKAERPQI